MTRATTQGPTPDGDPPDGPDPSSVDDDLSSVGADPAPRGESPGAVVRSDRAASAIAAARARTRRAWRFQLIGAVVLVVLLGTGLWVVWRHSEIRAVHIRTTTIGPSALPTGAVPPTLAEAWRTTDRAATGSPVQQDVVATYSEHTVSGRDAATGAVRWSYTRTDRRICAVDAQDTAVVAIYAHDGLCDEVTGLDAGSGQRIWVRTLLSSGTPATLAVSSQSGNILLVTPDAVELIEPTGGLDWWYDDQPDGCVTRSAVLGTAGVLMANRCGTKDTLSLRALGSSKERAWTVDQKGRTPLSADAVVSVLAADGRSVDVLAAQLGTTSSTIPLTTTVQAAAVPGATPFASGKSVEVAAVRGGSLGLVAGSPPRLLWQRIGAGLPTSIDDGLLAPTATGAELLDPLDGRAIGTYRAAGSSASDVVNQLGRGLLLSSSTGTAAYR